MRRKEIEVKKWWREAREKMDKAKRKRSLLSWRTSDILLTNELKNTLDKSLISFTQSLLWWRRLC